MIPFNEKNVTVKITHLSKKCKNLLEKAQSAILGGLKKSFLNTTQTNLKMKAKSEQSKIIS